MTPFQFTCALDPSNPDHRRVMVPWDDAVGELAADIAAEPVRYPQIYAPRQMGKSTLCLQVLDWIRREHAKDWLACHVDCGAAAGGDVCCVVGLLHDAVLQEALRYARAEPGGSDELLGKLTGLARPATTYQFSLFLEQVAGILRGVTRLALIVDEVDCLGSATLYQVLCAFRALHHRYTRLKGQFACCVVAASSRDLAALKIGPGSPYNITWLRFTHEVKREQWVTVLSQAGCVPFVEEALDRLFAEVGGHPYLLQRLCDRAVATTPSGTTDAVGEGHVLDAIGWLFEKGDRNLRVMSHDAEADPDRRGLCDRLLQGHLVRFERTLDPINDLTDVGLLRDADHRVVFRNRLYERLMLNRRYDHLRGPTGMYLWEYGHLLVRCSEIERVVLNADLIKEVAPKIASANPIRRGGKRHLVRALVEVLGGPTTRPSRGSHPGRLVLACVDALGRSANPVLRDVDTGFINRWLRSVYELGADGDLTREQVLEVIARLLVEHWQCEQGGVNRAT